MSLVTPLFGRQDSNRCPPAAKCVYLTFDDGPDPQWTPRVLDILARAGATATFFVIGALARRTPELLRQTVADGHDIGNHTFGHRHPWTMSRAKARGQVRDGAAAIADILGSAPRFYRPPHGRNRDCMTQEARQLGELLVMWDRSATDWGSFGTADRIARRLARVQAGDVVLMHDGRNRHNRPDQMIDVLPDFLAMLKNRSLFPVALGRRADDSHHRATQSQPSRQ